MRKTIKGKGNNVYDEKYHSKAFSEIGKKYLPSQYCVSVTSSGVAVLLVVRITEVSGMYSCSSVFCC